MRYLLLKGSVLLLLSSLSISLLAGPGNIAPQATITASTELNAGFSARNIVDGVIRIPGKGEWACLGDTTDWGYIRFPWIQLE